MRGSRACLTVSDRTGERDIYSMQGQGEETLASQAPLSDHDQIGKVHRESGESDALGLEYAPRDRCDDNTYIDLPFFLPETGSRLHHLYGEVYLQVGV